MGSAKIVHKISTAAPESYVSTNVVSRGIAVPIQVASPAKFASKTNALAVQPMVIVYLANCVIKPPSDAAKDVVKTAIVLVRMSAIQAATLAKSV
jgi:hypothetical protein